MVSSAPATYSDGDFRIFFGGPDRPPRALRDLLRDRISAVPVGGEIFWATYYFRDEALADTLAQARRRGVRVRLTLEANPRTSRANLAVAKKLGASEVLGGDFRFLRHNRPDNLLWKKPRLHIKLYYFSHPRPHVLIGTFNPSGNDPEDSEIITEIGDQDRGHNFLLELSDQRLVPPLRDHLVRIHSASHGPWERLLPENNRVISAGGTDIFLFPRMRRNILQRKLAGLPQETVVRMAVSHMNDKGVGKILRRLADCGVTVSILAHDTERRIPSWMENCLTGTLTFRRYRHTKGLPMHNKFILIDSPGGREVLLGSINLSERSLHANHELLLVTTRDFLYDAFHHRWQQMIFETEQMTE